MKILFIFCDMLRANLLSTFNPKIRIKGPVDYLLDEIGGTAFTNCYTPAPDSPRSLACLFTGCYPKTNGCDTRIKWPKFYLNDDIETLFDLLSKYGFRITISLTTAEELVGFLPSRLPPGINRYYSPCDIKNVIKGSMRDERNLFFFITLDDYHWSMDDYGYNSLGDYCGQKHICNYLDMFFNDCEINAFDYIFLFSDHGSELDSEKTDKRLFLPNDNRTKIVMFIRRKNDTGITANDKICTIMDILPTMQDILEMKNKAKCDGISLFGKSEHDSIVIEDHRNFSVALDQVIENFAVRTKKYFYFTDLKERAVLKVISANKYEKVLEPEADLITNFEKQIEIKSSAYIENKKQYDILKYYQEMAVSRDPYSDGEVRIKNKRNLIFRLKKKIKKNKHIRW